MKRDDEKRLLQWGVAVAALVPITFGTIGVVRGGAWLTHGSAAPDLDSHFRYLSGIFLMMGLAFASCVPEIERMGPRFRLLGILVVAGGLARALSLLTVGTPSGGHFAGLVMELAVLPLLMVWQTRVAKRFAGE